MAEIEIKAWAKNRQSIIQALNSFATYQGKVIRDDQYWGLSVDSKIKIRIRKETRDSIPSYLVTYKKKEQHQSQNGAIIEVNDEKECSISDPLPLTSFLQDSGYMVTLNKHKEVMDWTLELEEIAGIKGLTATFELCNVPPLGDFMEIEIISPTMEEKAVAALNSKLQELLLKTSIPLSDIEPRYYSQMIREHCSESQKDGPR